MFLVSSFFLKAKKIHLCFPTLQVWDLHFVYDPQPSSLFDRPEWYKFTSQFLLCRWTLLPRMMRLKPRSNSPNYRFEFQLKEQFKKNSEILILLFNTGYFQFEAAFAGCNRFSDSAADYKRMWIPTGSSALWSRDRCRIYRWTRFLKYRCNSIIICDREWDLGTAVDLWCGWMPNFKGCRCNGERAWKGRGRALIILV